MVPGTSDGTPPLSAMFSAASRPLLDVAYAKALPTPEGMSRSPPWYKSLPAARIPTTGTLIGWFNGNAISLSGLENVVAVAANEGYGMVLLANGSLLSTNPARMSVPVAAASCITAVSAGKAHVLALHSSGGVMAWGTNNDLGQANVPASALANVVAIAAGDAHSLALLSNGTVVAWGWGLMNQTSVPPHAQGQVISIAAGHDHSVLLLRDGTVVAFGANHLGQSNVPAEVLSKKAVAVAAKRHSSVAILHDGAVSGWGELSSLPPPGPCESQLSPISATAGLGWAATVRVDGTVAYWGGASEVSPNNNWNANCIKGARTLSKFNVISLAAADNGNWLAIARFGARNCAVCKLGPRVQDDQRLLWSSCRSAACRKLCKPWQMRCMGRQTGPRACCQHFRAAALRSI
jgi:hypothetical protein